LSATAGPCTCSKPDILLPISIKGESVRVPSKVKTIRAEWTILRHVATEKTEVGGLTSKGRGKIKSPFSLLMLGLLLAFVGFIFTGLVMKNNDTASRASALFIALVGLFTGTIVYMRIYDYVNMRNQVRQWRFDYALRRVEGIYAPLWEQTQGLINSIRGYDSADNWTYRYREVGRNEKSVGFKQITESHLRLFLDSEAHRLLRDFHFSIDDYQRLHNLAWTKVYGFVNQEISKLTGEKQNQFTGNSSQMLAVFINNQKMMYDSDYPIDDATKEIFLNAHKNIFHDPAKGQTDFDSLLTSMRDLEEVREFRQKRKDALPKGEAVLGRLKEIIEDPMSVVLDFEDQ